MSAVAVADEAASWDPPTLAKENSLQFLTVGPQEREHWSTVWVVAVDDHMVELTTRDLHLHRTAERARSYRVAVDRSGEERLPMRIKRILVPTDLSEASMPALKLAAEFAKTFKAELVLLFVVEPFYTSGDILSAGAVASVVEAQNKTAGTALAREAARLGERGVRARSMVVEGTAAATIVERAWKGSADLIIIGTHGRSGFSRVFIGSVAERVVQTARCPVLTVRSPAEQTTRKVASKHRGPRGSAGGISRPSTTTLV